MASSLNASTSGGGGVIVTSDASGNLDIQSGGSTVVAVTSAGATVTGTLSATGAVTLTGSLNTPNTFGFKNRIINGGMVIDQRNAGASVNPSSAVPTYIVDRFVAYQEQTSKFTVQQNAGSVTPPVGFVNYLGVTSSSAYSATTGQVFSLWQSIEGFNVADLNWGSANAKTVTLSFQVYSSLTGTFGGSLKNSAGNRSYPFTYTISAANTWTSISITVAGDTTGTWLTTNGIGVTVYWSLGTGTTYQGTAGAWAAANYLSATGATSVVGTSGATFYITGVQLEKGSTATSFDYRPYGTELALCQRYYYNHVSGATAQAIANFCNYSATQARGVIHFPVSMRTAPSLVASSGTDYYEFRRNGAADLFNSLLILNAAPNCSGVYNDTEISGTAGQAGTAATNSASASIGFSAEL